MRVRLSVVIAALAASGPAAAAGLLLPEAKPLVRADAYSSPVIEHPWIGQKPDARLVEKPIGELIATKFGVANGSAELFRLQMENGSIGRPAVLDGVVDGGGVRLKLSW